MMPVRLLANTSDHGDHVWSSLSMIGNSVRHDYSHSIVPGGLLVIS